MFAVPFFALLFSIFPLTDTDIWWHLACAREWVTTWTLVRTPVVNVHEYFQLVVDFVYGLGGAPFLVAFKAILWGIVFALFLLPKNPKCHCEARRTEAFSSCMWQSLVAVVLLFIFRYHFEIRPVLFSLIFLGVYWNIFPKLVEGGSVRRKFFAAVTILAIQWFWCKFQGLYILGPLFALLVLVAFIRESRRAGEKLSLKAVAWRVAFVLVLFAMPFLHREGLSLFLYPFGLLDRLLGLTPSAAVFASQIAENRSPFRLLVAGENVLECVLMIALCFVGMFAGLRRLFRYSGTALGRDGTRCVAILVTGILALVAERNFVLFLPLFLGAVSENRFVEGTFKSVRCRLGAKYAALFVVAFIVGLWTRSLAAYDYSMVSYQRVPVDAANWMLQNPHAGRLFNDDRAGGYLAFVNPADSIYMDGRFILKTADFFERYLEYAKNPALFIADADSLNIDRAVLPLLYYARWDSLLQTLEKSPRWHLAYRDDYFVVFDKN